MNNVSFNRDGFKFDIPSFIIDDSLTIKDTIADSDSISSIEIKTTLPISSLEAMTDSSQSQLPVLDFLNCPKLMLTTGMEIINHSQSLTEFTKQLFYSIPQLAYTALLKNLLTHDQVPPYDSVLISRESFIEWIDNDLDKAIILLNLGVPPVLLSPDITVSTLNSVNKNVNRYPLTYQCCINDQNHNSTLITLLSSLVDRLDELKPEVLEPLIRHFRYSVILDKMFRLRLIENIKNLVNDDMIPEAINYSWLAVELKDDELVDMVMELRLSGGVDEYPTSSNYATSFVMGALQHNYLYPLKYINSESLKKCGINIRPNLGLTISQEGLDQVVELMSRDSSRLLNELINLLMFNDRTDSAIPLLELLTIDKLIESRNQWKLLPLSMFKNEEQYRQVMGREFKMDAKNILLIVRGDYAGLAKTVADQLTNDQLLMVLTIQLLSEADESIIKFGMLKRIVELIDIESFRQFIIKSILAVIDIVNRCPTAEVIAEEMGLTEDNTSLELMCQVLLVSAIIMIRDKDREWENDEAEVEVVADIDEADEANEAEIDIDEEIIAPRFSLSEAEEESMNIHLLWYNSVPDQIMISQQSYGCEDSMNEMMRIDENHWEGIGSIIGSYVIVLKQLLELDQ